MMMGAKLYQTVGLRHKRTTPLTEARLELSMPENPYINFLFDQTNGFEFFLF